MPNYQEGKIYEIVSDDGKRYIGSTTKTLEERLSSHKNKHNKTISRELIEKNYKINLLLEYPCNSKKELLDKEAEYIKNTECINCNIPGRTRKEWAIDNKEKLKKYREDNKEKTKQYRQDNKEKWKDYRQKSYEKIECNICNRVVRKNDFARHKKTKICQMSLADNLEI